MERKPKVTQELVNTSCEELAQADKNITVNAVIGITGGSFSTVGGMVKAWKEKQAQQSAPVLEMPEKITQAMHTATADIWGIASNLAGERVEQIQKEAEEITGKAKTDLAEYTGEVARLEGELEQTVQASAETEAKLVDMISQVSDLTAQNTILETRLSDRDSELERVRVDYQVLQGELVEIAKRSQENKKQ